jgi:hypothetical protein
VRVRLGDPRVVPCFRITFPIDLPPSTSPGSPSVALALFFANGPRLRRDFNDSALPFTPSYVSHGKTQTNTNYALYAQIKFQNSLVSLPDDILKNDNQFALL